MEKTINIPLKTEMVKGGIIIFKNEETGVHHFALDDEKKEIITCPDGKSTFDKVDVYPNIVICQLPWWRNFQPTDGEWHKVFRIYLRDEAIWLQNPKVIEDINDPDPSFPLGSEEKQCVNNFFRILSFNKDFIHLRCEKNQKEDRVYLLQNKCWIGFPNFNSTNNHFVEHFSEVDGGKFQGRDCLIFTDERKMKSVYFLKSENTIEQAGEYFSIPESEEKGKGRVFFFDRMYQNYLLLTTRISSNEDEYMVWRLDKNCYYIPSSKLEKLSKGTIFTEEYIAIKVASSDASRVLPNCPYHIISTKKWRPVVISQVFSTSSVQFPTVDEDGNLSVEMCLSSLKCTLSEKTVD